MSLIRPFAGLRPTDATTAQVIAPPYDVISTAEARQLAAGQPYSFLHVSRAEIDLPPQTGRHAPAVYAQAATYFTVLCDQGVLQQDPTPAFYVYRLTQGVHQQTGIMATVSIAAYLAQRVQRHEFTRPDKEDDRLHHMEALNAQTGPAFLAYPPDVTLARWLAAWAARHPDADAELQGVRHQLWRVTETEAIAALQQRIEQMPKLYIADGHHRTAAAARLGQARGLEGAAGYFLAGLFPSDQLQILAYHRIVLDLGQLTALQLQAALATRGILTPATEAVAPVLPGEFGMYLAGQWYRWQAKTQPEGDLVTQLDVSILSDQVLAPILGITDLRRDPRIDFIGGGRGLQALVQAVDSGKAAVAFSLRPTAMADLMAIADAGGIMPPKSTWFEPKLADGLVSHPL